MTEKGGYILATGKGEVERLRLLNEVYGPGSEALLRAAGLGPGIRVVEVGCGSGNVSCWLAGQVGEGGAVVGVDNSPAQVEQARLQAQARGLANVTFVVGDACAPPLPAGSFDLACCRLVLMHLTRPADGLWAMRELVRPGGRVVCEEMDLTRWLCDPPSALMGRSFELNVALGDRRGAHFRLGSSLHRLFREAGFARPEVSANFPVALRGEVKRLLGLSFQGFAPALVADGLAPQEEVDRIAAEVLRLAGDETTLFGFPLVGQVWATK
jgi:SAM-dependent methyltransferase